MEVTWPSIAAPKVRGQRQEPGSSGGIALRLSSDLLTHAGVRPSSGFLPIVFIHTHTHTHTPLEIAHHTHTQMHARMHARVNAYTTHPLTTRKRERASKAWSERLALGLHTTNFAACNEAHRVSSSSSINREGIRRGWGRGRVNGGLD